MTRCTSANPQTSFDYAQLPQEQAKLAREAAEAIRVHQQQTLESILAIGQKVFEVKDKLDHGQFGAWLTAEFGWSIRTAQRWIAVWSEFRENCDSLAHLPLTTIYALAAPSTPTSVRTEVIERIQSGHRCRPLMLWSPSGVLGTRNPQDRRSPRSVGQC